MKVTTEYDLAGMYRETRERLTALLSDLDATAFEVMVPACPDWAVRDVVAHLTAITEDAITGRLTGIPNDQRTADQVVRMAEVPVPELLRRWQLAGPQFEELVARFGVWPAVIDIVSHEQDIRGTVGCPGARDTDALRRCASELLTRLTPPLPVRVVTEDGEYVTGEAEPGDAAVLTVSSSTYEVFRWRMGRRSRAQLAALDWSADPTAVLDHMSVFGPAASDIIE